LVAAAGLAAIHPAYAIDPSRAMSQYVRDHWGTEQGFPKGPVYAITQTSDGYLWIGTGAGLVRFDGRNFGLIRDNSGAFTIAGVIGLASNRDGSLWLRLQDLTIVHYRDGVFDHPSSDAQSYLNVHAMSQGNQGELLISKAEQAAVAHREELIAPLAFRNGRFEKLAPESDIPRSAVHAVVQTPNGDIWMGTREDGLFRFTAGRTVPVRRGLPDPKVNCLLADGERELWVGTDDGVVRWNGKELTAAGVPPSLRHFQALSLTRDRDGNLWVGTDSRGLLRVNSQGVSSLGPGDGSSAQAVTAVFEDREGDLWIGQADGIERLRDSAFVTYSAPEGLPTEGSHPVFVDSEDRLWFPPVGGGLWWVKGDRHGSVTNDGLDRDVVYALDGGQGEIWLGRQRGGLTQLRIHNRAFLTRTYTHAQGLAQDSVYSVYRARDGTIWAGTLSAGISMLKHGQFTNYTVEQGLASNTVVSILEASDGTMWFATPSGLSAFSKSRWEVFRTGQGLPSDNINCLLEDSAGLLWAGTAAGIAFRGSGAAFQVPPQAPELLRGQILGLAEDKSGALWVATSNHVLRVNRVKLSQGVLDEGDIREYGLADGLRGVGGVKRHRSVVPDQAGRIWFSLDRGIAVVDPTRLARNAAPAIVHIENISADDSPIPMGSQVHIPGGRQRIIFGFAGMGLSLPDRIRYRYWLEGFDHTWSEQLGSREAVYTNLGPGQYRFRVVASDADGVWNGQEADLSFRVDPLYWQTWWFGSVIVAMFIAGAFVAYRFRLLRATKRLSLRYQERLAERTRIAQELHDTLLQGFLSASMQVHVAADTLPDDSAAKRTLTRALELMRQVIDEGRNAVRGLRSSKSVSLDLEQALSRIQQELAPQQDGDKVAFRVIVDGEKLPLQPLVRDELYRIGREALINAFRHAHARHVELEIKYASNRLGILVRDDGCGIDPKILQSGRDGHFGLSGMRERADRIGARIRVMSSPSAGTEIQLAIPGSVAFQTGSNGKVSWFSGKTFFGRKGRKN
jgi:ligand-binding sensor domain-containing protein/signal transduction histidine kinase